MRNGEGIEADSCTDVDGSSKSPSGPSCTRTGPTRKILAVAVVVIMVASAIAVVSFNTSKDTLTEDEDQTADAEVNGAVRKVNFEISRLGESYLKPTDYSKLGRSDHTQSGINEWYIVRNTMYNDTIMHNSWPYVISSAPYSSNLVSLPRYNRTSWATHTFDQLKIDAENITELATGAGKDPWIVPIMGTQAQDGGWVNMSLYETYLTSQEYADIRAGTHYANTFYGVSATDYENVWGRYYSNDGLFTEIQGHWDFNRNAAKKFLGLPGAADLRTEFNAVGANVIAQKWRQEWINDGDAGMPLDTFTAYDYSLYSGNGPVYVVVKLDAANSTASKIALWFWSHTWGGEFLFARYMWKVGIEEEMMSGEREDWYINATLGPINGDVHERLTNLYHVTAWADKQAYNNPTWMLEPQHMDFTADNGYDPYVSYFDDYYCLYWSSTYLPSRMNYNPGVSTYGQRVHYWVTPMNWNLAADETLTIKLPASDRLGWGVRPYWSNNFTLPGNAVQEMQSNGRTGEFVLGHGHPANLYSTTYYDPATKTITIPGGSSFAPNMNPIPGYTNLYETGSPLFFFDISPVSHYRLDVLGGPQYSAGQVYTLMVTPLNISNSPVRCNQTVELPQVTGVTYGASLHTFLPSESEWNTTVIFATPNKNYTLASRDAYFYLDIVDTKTIYVGGGAGNSPPTVDLASQFTVVKRVTYTYSVSASDPDNDILKYTWNWGDKTQSVTYTNYADHSYSKKGTYTLTVTVDDQTGLAGHIVSDSATVYVLDSEPAPSGATNFGFPGFPQSLDVNTPVDFLLQALDSKGVVSTSYRGTVGFRSTDPQATLPNQYTFTKADSGQHWFTNGQLVFMTPGIQILNAYDVKDPTISGNVTVTVIDPRITLLNESFNSWGSLDRHWTVWNCSNPIYNNIDVSDGVLRMTNLAVFPVNDSYNAMANWSYPMIYASNLTISFRVYLPLDEYYKEGIFGQFVAIGLYDTNGVQRLFARFLMDNWGGSPSGFVYATQYSTWSKIAGFTAGWHNCSISLLKGASTWVASFDGAVYGGLTFSNSLWSASDLSKIVIYNALREEPVVAMIDDFVVAKVGPPAPPPLPNTPPVADFFVYPPSGNPGTFLIFNGSISHDNEDPLSALKFRWDWEGDGIWDTAWVANPIGYHVYGVGGVFQPALEVMDTGGLVGRANHTFIVDANPPFCDAGPDILAYHGEPVTLSASGSFDAETAIVEYIWSYVDYYGTHFLYGSDVTVTMLYYTQQRVPVTLTVWDAAGNPATDTCTVTIWPYRETVLKMSGPDSKSYVTLFYQAPGKGDWTVFIENHGLRSVGLKIFERYDDNLTMPSLIYQDTIKFQSAGAYPSGTVYLPTLQMKRGLTYQIDAYPSGAAGTSADFGCTFVSANQAPVASLVYAKDGLTVSADSSGSYDPDGDPLRFVWDWGDGTRGYGTTATHAYAAYGSYLITLKAIDDAGMIGQTSQYIVFTLPPVAVIHVVSVSGHTVTVDGSLSYDPDGSIMWYSWTWGDGTPPTPPSSVPTASHTYASSGTYIIRLQVFDNMGESTLAYQSVTVGLPIPPFIVAGYTKDGYGNPLPGCNVRVTNLMTGAFQDTVSDGVYAFYQVDLSAFQYAWQIGDVIRVLAWNDTLNGSREVLLTSENTNAGILLLDVQLRIPGPPPFPYLIAGYTNGTDGSPLFGCSVIVTDLRTGAYLSTTSDATYGWYDVDLTQIAGGFMVGDTIRVSATLGAMSGMCEVVIVDSAASYIQADVTLS